jgi:hypothetical protein
MPATREIAPGLLEIVDFFPQGIRALQTTRRGGFSSAPYDSFNLGTHVGDRPEAVQANRDRLTTMLPQAPVWLNQVHGVEVLDLNQARSDGTIPTADACISSGQGRVCAVMTADCLPVLIARPGQQQVAAAHAGWRGLVSGVIEATLDQLLKQQAAQDADPWWVWLGPCIGPNAFEVGPEVRAQFIAKDAKSAAAFREADPIRQSWYADLQWLAERRIRHWASVNLTVGSAEIRLGADRRCVYQHRDLFFSYRRDHLTGRMASLIYCGKP